MSEPSEAATSARSEGAGAGGKSEKGEKTIDRFGVELVWAFGSDEEKNSQRRGAEYAEERRGNRVEIGRDGSKRKKPDQTEKTGSRV